jgi:hypothetical protein
VYLCLDLVGLLIQGLPFYAVDGKALCERDYTNTLEKCCKCFNPILDRILRATGEQVNLQPKSFGGLGK